MLLDMAAPKINHLDAQGSVKSIHSWLITLVDEINNCLCHIDEGNLSDAFYDTLTAVKVVAQTVISNTVITQNLYAEYGDIADLTVDRLVSGNKVARYSASDLSDINYIWAQDQSMKLITGTTDGSTTQHKDRNGALLYWKDAEKLAMGTEPTSYPVTVYKYTELVKAEFSFAFDSASGQQVPKLTLGSGTGVGDNGKAFLYKGMDGLYIDYRSAADGSLRRIMLNDTGIYMTPYVLESLDFYSDGFSARYSGETVSYTWTKDTSGRITSLTTADNVTIPVTWNTGAM